MIARRWHVDKESVPLSVCGPRRRPRWHTDGTLRSSDPGRPSALTCLGYDARWAALFTALSTPGRPMRVVSDHRGAVLASDGERDVRIKTPPDLRSVTGDWLALSGDRIVEILQRASAVVRTRAGGESQVLAANIDFVGILHGLDQPLNRRRLERGLVLAWEGGAQPVIILTEAAAARAQRWHAPRHPGVARADDRRRHRRHRPDVSRVDELSASCRFSDCRHDREPECAVLAAVEGGELDPDRFEGWRRVRREADSARLRADPLAIRQRNRQWGRSAWEDAIRLKRGDQPRGSGRGE